MVDNPYVWSPIALGVFQLLNTNYQVGHSDVKGWVLNAQRPFSTAASLRWWPIWSTHKHALPFICFVLVSCSSGSLYSSELYLIDQLSTGGFASNCPSHRLFGARLPCTMTVCLIHTFLPLFHKVIFDLLYLGVRAQRQRRANVFICR